MTEPQAASRPVALVADAGFYVGPSLARLLADRGFDLVLGDPSAGLADELAEATGTAVEVVTGCRDLAVPGNAQQLVDAALARFGRLDSATAFSGRIVTGRFMRSSVDDLRAVMEGCMVAPYEFMKAVLPPMIDAHAHYSAPAAAAFTPAEVIARLDAAGVRRLAVTSSPPQLAQRLYRHAPGRIIPLLGVYASDLDKGRWMHDAGLPARVAAVAKAVRAWDGTFGMLEG